MEQATGESGRQQQATAGGTAPAGTDNPAQQTPAAAPVLPLEDEALDEAVGVHSAMTQPQGAVASNQADHQVGLQGLSWRILSHAPSSSDGAATILVREDEPGKLEPGKDEVGSAVETIRLDAVPRIAK